MSDDKALGILDVKSALEDVFKGCEVRTPNAMAGSFHAEVTFDEYEVRVILVGRRNNERTIHFRFMQRMPGPGKKPVKHIINEFQTQDPKKLMQAIKDCKAYLLGIVHAIQTALNPKPTNRTQTINDLLFRD